MNDAPELQTVTRDNVGDACRIEIAPEQTAYVAPVSHSPAEAYVNRETAWPRLVYRRLGFEPTGDEFHGQIVGALDL